MTGRNRLSKLTENLSPERQARIERRRMDLWKEPALQELRRPPAGQKKPRQVKFGTNQPAVTEMERPADVPISSLKRMLETIGDSLAIKTRFPKGDVTITSYMEE